MASPKWEWREKAGNNNKTNNKQVKPIGILGGGREREVWALSGLYDVTETVGFSKEKEREEEKQFQSCQVYYYNKWQQQLPKQYTNQQILQSQ